MTDKGLSYTMRWPVPTGLPPIRACCGKHHPMPFQHVHVYQDKNGRTKHLNECNACYRDRGEERPPRWAERNSDMCIECRQALKAQVGKAPKEDAGAVFGTIAKNNPLQPRGWF